MPGRDVPDGDGGRLRCSAPAVVRAAAFSRPLFGRGKFTALPASPLTGARAALEVVLGAPLLSVELTASPSGELIRDYLLARRRGVRTHLYAQTVLCIPPIGAEMLKGRRFRAARTNITRARREGITCRDLPESERPRVLRGAGRVGIAVGADGRPLVGGRHDRSFAGGIRHGDGRSEVGTVELVGCASVHSTLFVEQSHNAGAAGSRRQIPSDAKPDGGGPILGGAVPAGPPGL